MTYHPFDEDHPHNDHSNRDNIDIYDEEYPIGAAARDAADRLDTHIDAFGVPRDDVDLLMGVGIDEAQEAPEIYCHARATSEDGAQYAFDIEYTYSGVGVETVVEEEYPAWVNEFTDRYGEDNIQYHVTGAMDDDQYG